MTGGLSRELGSVFRDGTVSGLTDAQLLLSVRRGRRCPGVRGARDEARSDGAGGQPAVAPRRARGRGRLSSDVPGAAPPLGLTPGRPTLLARGCTRLPGGSSSGPTGLADQPVQLRAVGSVTGRVVSERPELTRGVPIFLEGIPKRGEPSGTTHGFAEVVTDNEGRFHHPRLLPKGICGSAHGSIRPPRSAPSLFRPST